MPLGNLRHHLQRIDAHHGHDRHLRLHQLAGRDQPLLDVAVERRADVRVAQLRDPRASGVASATSISARRFWRSGARRRTRPASPAAWSAHRRGPAPGRARACGARRAIVSLLRLRKLGRGLPDVRRLFGRGAGPFRGAVLGQRPGERRLLLLEAVLEPFAVELHERLIRLYSVPEVGQHAPDDAFAWDETVTSSSAANVTDDFDAAVDRSLTHGFNLDGLRRRLAAARLSCFRLGARGRKRAEQRTKSDNGQGGRGSADDARFHEFGSQLKRTG